MIDSCDVKHKSFACVVQNVSQMLLREAAASDFFLLNSNWNVLSQKVFMRSMRLVQMMMMVVISGYYLIMELEIWCVWVRRKEEVHSVCAEQILCEVVNCIHVYVHKTIIVSRMVEIEAQICAYSAPMLPVQMIGGILSCVLVVTAQIVDDALHLSMTFVALLFQHIVVHDCQQILRHISFGPQSMVGEIAHAECIAVGVRQIDGRFLFIFHIVSEFDIVMYTFGLIVRRRSGRQIARLFRFVYFMVVFRYKLSNEFRFGQILAIQQFVVARINHLNECMSIGQLPQTQRFPANPKRKRMN